MNKKITGGLGLIVILATAPFLSHAQSDALDVAAGAVGGIFSDMTDVFRWATETIGIAISYITAQLIALAGYVIQMMINLSTHIIETPAVQEGFKVSLSFANLGFTLAIIFIAFITIFRLQGYETKKLLRNLIVAAVLINFSFTFAGLIMDSSHIFANFFIKQLGGGNPNQAENVVNGLANALNIQRVNIDAPSSDALGEQIGAAGSYLKMIASISLMVLYNSVIVITFFSVAGLMILRYIIITFLLIIMPFAWLCWIFPSLSGNWKKWWNEFIKWNIFLPVLMFFIYLAVYTSTKIGESTLFETFINGYGGDLAKTGGVAAGLTVFGIKTLAAMVQGIVQVALLFGGLVAAQKMGIAGSDSIMKASSTVKGWVTGAAMSATGVPMAGRLAKRGGGAVVTAAGTKVASSAYSTIAAVSGAVGGRRLQAWALSKADAPKEAAKKSIEERAKAIVSQYSSKESFAALMQSNAISDHESAARALAVAQKGNIEDIDKLDRGRMSGYLKSAKKMGVEKKISENNIGLASRMEEDFDMKRALSNMTAEDLAKQKPEAFKSPDVIKNMDADVLENLLKSKKLAPKKMEAIIQGASELYEQDSNHKAKEAIYSNVKVVGALKKMAEKIDEKIKNKENVTDKEKQILRFAAQAPAETPTAAPKTGPQTAATGGLATGQQQTVLKATKPVVGGEQGNIKIQRKQNSNKPVDEQGNTKIT